MNSQNIFSIEGLNTVVTGAAMGIGFAIAQRFVDAGANALLVDVDEGALRSACDKLSKPGTPGIGKVASLAIDLGSDGAGESLVRRCVEKFGSIDLLVNNAGIYPQVPILKMTPEVFDRVIRVNLRGLVMASRAAGLELVKQGRGGGDHQRRFGRQPPPLHGGSGRLRCVQGGCLELYQEPGPGAGPQQGSRQRHPARRHCNGGGDQAPGQQRVDGRPDGGVLGYVHSYQGAHGSHG